MESNTPAKVFLVLAGTTLVFVALSSVLDSLTNSSAPPARRVRPRSAGRT